MADAERVNVSIYEIWNGLGEPGWWKLVSFAEAERIVRDLELYRPTFPKARIGVVDGYPAILNNRFERYAELRGLSDLRNGIDNGRADTQEEFVPAAVGTQAASPSAKDALPPIEKKERKPLKGRRSAAENIFIASEIFGRRVSSAIEFVRFIDEADLLLWDQYYQYQQDLIRKGILTKSKKRVSDFAPLYANRTFTVTIIDENGEKIDVTKKLAYVEKLGKKVGFTIKEGIYKGRKMLRKWACGCVEFVNWRGESNIKLDGAPGHPCELRNYYGKKLLAGQRLDFDIQFDPLKKV